MGCQIVTPDLAKWQKRKVAPVESDAHRPEIHTPEVPAMNVPLRAVRGEDVPLGLGEFQPGRPAGSCSAGHYTQRDCRSPKAAADRTVPDIRRQAAEPNLPAILAALAYTYLNKRGFRSGRSVA